MTVFNQACLWVADIVPLLAMLGTFIYGVKNFFKKGKAYYLQIVTMAMGCYAMGSFYHLCQSITTGDLADGFRNSGLKLNHFIRNDICIRAGLGIHHAGCTTYISTVALETTGATADVQTMGTIYIFNFAKNFHGVFLPFSINNSSVKSLRSSKVS